MPQRSHRIRHISLSYLPTSPSLTSYFSFSGRDDWGQSSNDAASAATLMKAPGVCSPANQHSLPVCHLSQFHPRQWESMKGKGHWTNLTLTSVLFGGEWGITGLGSKGQCAVRQYNAVASYPPERHGQRWTVGGRGLGVRHWGGGRQKSSVALRCD